MDRSDPSDPTRPGGPDRPSIRLTGTEQSEHDALAELFLGDAPFAPKPMLTPETRARDAERPEPAGERAGERPPTPEPGAGRGRFDGNAVRAERAESHGEAVSDERPVTELVILGHLPVRASLWVRHYACLSARKRSETVALVRAAGGSVSIDVITGREAAEIEPVGSIEDGVTIARAASTRVILRVDETVEPELLEREGVDEVTILTGADEAAVVASYRLIKTLVAGLDDRLDPEAAPLVRVAVMGNPGPEIAAACAKIERACRAFLDRPVEILDASGRIDATGTVTVCRTDAPGATDELLGALLDRPAEPAPAPTPLRLTEEHDGPDETEDASGDEAGTRADTGPMPEVVVLPGAGSHAARSAGERVPAEAPASDRIVEPKFRLREPLACLVEGLEPIEARCPGAPGVELARDRSGRLHALSTDDRGSGDAVASLLAASAWARANLSLLIRAEAGIAIPAPDPYEECDAVLHLLARRPSAARGVLDTPVRVYALASVVVDGEEIMVATPINESPNDAFAGR